MQREGPEPLKKEILKTVAQRVEGWIKNDFWAGYFRINRPALDHCNCKRCHKKLEHFTFCVYIILQKNKILQQLRLPRHEFVRQSIKTVERIINITLNIEIVKLLRKKLKLSSTTAAVLAPVPIWQEPF